MTYQALIFDVGGVIVGHDNARMHRTLASRCSAGEAYEGVVGHDKDRRFTTGELPIRELHRRLTDELGYGGDWASFAQDYCCHLWVEEEMLVFLEGLASANRVELFSNTNAVHWARVRAMTGGRIDRFVQHLSHQIGMLKPDIEAFALVAERAGLDPARCLFLDDVMANVEAARRAGFQAEPFTTRAALAELLASRGVTWPEGADA
jgi:FMN phosphatase YigB (HAD superfamily)